MSNYFKSPSTKTAEKVFTGSYSYLKNQNVYCEETFSVYKERKDLNIRFVSEILSRVATGELLNIHVNYLLSKDYLPKSVLVTRSLGKDRSEEYFEHDLKNNTLHYTFTNRSGEERCEITTPPKFHISTPMTANSILFIRTKKFDNTAKNVYTVINSNNQWSFKEKPKTNYVSLERVSINVENINIEGSNVQGIQYRLYEEGEDTNVKHNPATTPHVKVWLSNHMAIPYIVKNDQGIKIQIKKLKNLEKTIN